MKSPDLVAVRRHVSAAELICLHESAVRYGADLFPAVTPAELQAAT